MTSISSYQVLLLLGLLFASRFRHGRGVDENRLLGLRAQAYSASTPGEMVFLWRQILEEDPQNLEAHVMLGNEMIVSPMRETQEEGFRLLEASFDPRKVSPVIDLNYPQAVVMAATIGRYRNQQDDYDRGKRFTEIAFNAAKGETQPGKLCLELQMATMWNTFPVTVEEADKSLQIHQKYTVEVLEALRSDPTLDIQEQAVSAMFPGAAPDPFVHCTLSLFPLSFYYRAETATVAAQDYELSSRLWPTLNFVSPQVRRFERERRKREPGTKAVIDRTIELGVIAGTMTEGHSVSEDFRGVLQRLDREIFHVTYIYVAEQNEPNPARFVYHHKTDKVMVLSKQETEVGRGDWVSRFHQEIASLKLDMILYLDLTMSTHVRRIGMGRLAPVQINTHGHPITSGHPTSVIQYYISWAEAELPYEEAQKHYTEELKLLPSGKIHQYYEPRILDNSRSRMDGQAFGHLTRADFDLPKHATVYVSMQKPFKLHPEFYEMFCLILDDDPNAHGVLHAEMNPATRKRFEMRLQFNGCKLDRVTLLPSQPHHRLLGLFQVSDVVLDSYFAGGCTTTREVLELGKAVVSLPAHLLGSRWTLAYYNIIDVENHIKPYVMAENQDDFIDLAVKLGTDAELRKTVESRIVAAIPRLFYRQEAVDAWQSLLLELSPVEQTKEGATKEEL